MTRSFGRFKFWAPLIAAVLMLLGSLAWGAVGPAMLLGGAAGSLSDPTFLLAVAVAITITLASRSALLSILTCIAIGPALTWYINQGNAEFYREIGVVMTTERFAMIAAVRTFALLTLSGLAWAIVKAMFRSKRA